MLINGTMLQERYEILEKIGSGGMSDVYKAKCHKLNRLVAIKVLKEEFSSDRNFVGKFKMEAQAAAGLSHPNIVNVYDVVDEDDMHYIVMELIEGITLKNYILKKGRLEPKESIGIAIQVAQGMAAAHEQHIIHRDIKPQNIIISRDGKVKVADFGIARAVSNQTIGATAIGSVHYISPEQARGGYSDERSDIYSLGITTFEMVTGKIPFEGDNTVTIALAHLEEPITTPRAWNPAVPVSLEQIILKCTQKKPEQRYESATDLINDLRRALLTPDLNFVQMTPLVDNTAPTMTISPRDLDLIKKSSKRPPAANQVEPSLYMPEHRQPQPKSGRDGKRDRDEDDINPKIEKLMTGVGVVVAVIIVAVLLVIFAQLSGIFNFTSKQPGDAQDTTQETQESIASLKDTEVYMPNVLGLSEADAEVKLKESNLTMRVAYDKSDTEEKGKVMAQENEAGSVVNKHSTVTVTISEGSDKIDLPAMALETLEMQAAKTLLEYKGVTVNVTEENSDTVEKGKVIRFEPADKVAPGGEVKLFVSKGPVAEMVKVPALAGRTEEEAMGDLERAKLTLGEVSGAFSDTVESGRIISQQLEAGIEVEAGTIVGFVVSQGPEKKNTRYVARIDENFSLKSVYGPGSDSSSLEISIVFKQVVGGEVREHTMMEPRVVNGDATIPIHYEIEGADGVLTGDLEIRDLTHKTILKSYPLTFVEGNH